MPNRLSFESSPYLLQHQNNPVDWYPWGEEALSRAKKEGKPILLSIGYSACHWCHVMEHESFENPQIAQLMNENFINIKVDREERPDLDQIYQNVALAMTRGGGWPLTVFLTPDLKPYYGGTYFPPEDRYGRPGFPKVLEALAHAFHHDSESVTENSEKLMEYILASDQISAVQTGKPSIDDFKKVTRSLLSRVDSENGGFGHAPKFPNTMILTYLWRYSLSTQDLDARRAVLLALTQMAQGGIYDQLGGGFHRYSVDESWRVPHFEKMLYDNALLLKLYSEVLLTDEKNLSQSEQKLFAKVLEQTVDYVLREMTDSNGGFFSAQDADSEGEEGKFFVWSYSDLREALTEPEFKAIVQAYEVSEEGNFEHGQNILIARKGSPEVSEKDLQSGCKKLLALRSQRVAPGLDNKILTSWNALMIGGLAWAGRALKNGDRAFAAAERCFQFLVQNCSRENHRLSASFQRGQAKGNAYLDDYAFLAMAALDLSRWSQSPQNYIQKTSQWLEVILDQFKNPDGIGYCFTSADHEKLISRPKTFFDQAIPSGTAVAVTCMLALAETGNARFEKEAEAQLAQLFHFATQNPFGMGEALSAGWLSLLGPVMISGFVDLCKHPHFFQNPAPADRSGILICHQKACSLPLSSKDAAGRLETILANPQP